MRLQVDGRAGDSSVGARYSLPRGAARVMETYHLTLSCDNRPGIVAAVATSLFEAGADIIEAQQFDDLYAKRFFMRVAFQVDKSNGDVKALRDRLAPVTQRYQMQWQLRARGERYRVLVLVSKYDHCLIDLLYRQRIGELQMDVAGIVSNHRREVLEISLPEVVPFHYLPIGKDNKPQQEQQIKCVIEETRADLIVLARYMQILSMDMCKFLAGRCINIHHSFLPGFKGAKPYSQAFDRGVKMIGATAHYVTEDLDEGPIVVQDTEPVSHTDSAEALASKGRDIERRVLACAVRYHLEDRVLLNGNKTIVFRD
jgi:formyltetrahydrofolate deformylase